MEILQYLFYCIFAFNVGLFWVDALVIQHTLP